MNTSIAFSNHYATFLTDLDEHASVFVAPLLTLDHYYSIQASSPGEEVSGKIFERVMVQTNHTSDTGSMLVRVHGESQSHTSYSVTFGVICRYIQKTHSLPNTVDAINELRRFGSHLC